MCLCAQGRGRGGGCSDTQWSVAIATWIPCQAQRQPGTPGTRAVPRTATGKQELLTAPKRVRQALGTQAPSPTCHLCPHPSPSLPPLPGKATEARLPGPGSAHRPAACPSAEPPGTAAGRSMETGPESRGQGAAGPRHSCGSQESCPHRPQTSRERRGGGGGHGGSGSRGPILWSTACSEGQPRFSGDKPASGHRACSPWPPCHLTLGRSLCCYTPQIGAGAQAVEEPAQEAR